MIFCETERLILRNVAPADAETMFDYRNNALCARYQRGQTRDRAGIEALIARHGQDELTVDAPCLIAVAAKDGGMVGEIVVMPEGGTISLGYTISYKHHRNGYAFEALTALIGLLHGRYPDWDFVSFTEPENLASAALLKKLGYRELGFIPALQSLAFGKWLRPDTESELAQALRQN